MWPEKKDNYPKPNANLEKGNDVNMTNVSKWVVDFRGYLKHQCE